MTKITLEIHDDVLSTINKIRNINDSGIDLEIPEGSVLFDNVINLKLIEKEADKHNMTIHFITKDRTGNSLLMMMDEQTGVQGAVPEGFEMEEDTLKSEFSEQRRIVMPKLPKINIKAPKVVKPFIIGVTAALIVFGIALYLTKTQIADTTIKIQSQPLARSVTLKVIANGQTDSTKNTLKGTVVSTSLDSTKEIETTGEKMIGSKAKGDAKIFNNTDSDKTFKKGTTLIYKKDDVEYKYVTTEEVEVPARTTEVVVDPPSEIITYGSKTVSIEAAEIGDKYNIEKDKDLTVSGQKSSNFTSKTSDKIEGGKSEKVKMVIEADKTKLKNDLLQELTTTVDTELAKKIGKSQVLIKGSYKTTTIKETYNHEVNDIADKISLTMSVQADELTYLKSDLDKLMDDLTISMIPEGFTLSDKEKEIKAEVLGNSSTSVLTATEADLQVTIKTYIVPDIKQDTLKEQLKGKSATEAEKILGGLRNIKGYSLEIKPGIPLFNKVPNNIDQININIERE